VQLVRHRLASGLLLRVVFLPVVFVELLNVLIKLFSLVVDLALGLFGYRTDRGELVVEETVTRARLVAIRQGQDVGEFFQHRQLGFEIPGVSFVVLLFLQSFFAHTARRLRL